MAFENRRYLIIPASVADQVDFNQVLETSAGTCRYSVDGSKTFVKYEVNVVVEDYVLTHVDAETNEEVTNTILAGTYGRPAIYDPSYPEHTHSEILEILATEEWTAPVEEGMM